MIKLTLKKIPLKQWLGILSLTVIAISVAVAITATNTSFTPQDQPVGYVAQDEVSNFILSSGTETVYRPDYEKEFWSGNLFAYPVDASGNVNNAAERWTGGANARLALQNFSTERFIATRNDSSPSVGVAFNYANLSTSQQAFFPTTTINNTSFTGTQIVNFLRGERTNESVSGMRIRSTGAAGTGGPVLGDIIHSRPYYLADATNPTIFVGANDGMLHAFNTQTGSERWAYVPSMLLNKMIKLAKPYGGVSNPHDYFVDGRINIGTLADSSRILVGALGAGGRGLYALTITGSTGLSASSNSDVASKVRWEIDGTTGDLNNTTPTVSNAYDNLGYTYGVPLLTKVNSGGTDAVIVGNGYNNNANGNYQAHLYVINASTGQLIASIAAGTDGTSSNPNGLFNPEAIDTNNDGKIDRVYAGDLKGTMWKFDLSSATPASWTSSALHITSPAQPITSTPAVSLHPSTNGYMVTFGTGAMLDAADTTNTSTHYVYGIWDGPYTNTTMLTQTLTERSYTYSGNVTRVRRSTANTPSWSNGGHKGWQVALVGGERVIGEGQFIESGRFYFATHNPTIQTAVGAGTVVSTTFTSGSGYTSASVAFSGGGGSGATATATVTTGGAIGAIQITNSGSGYTAAPTITITGNGSGATATAVLSAGIAGENWLMELDAVTGGSKNEPFLDLDQNLLLNDGDRIKYISGDPSIPGTCNVSDPVAALSVACAIPGTDGIPVGKWISTGVNSQPILVQLQTLNTTLFNRNPNVRFPVTEISYGITGGHFDEDIYYGTRCTNTTGNVAATQAFATILVGTAGQTANLPATLGGIKVDATTIVPVLGITNITDGTATGANAIIIRNAVAGGYTATVSGNVVTIRAPAGASYNGKVLNILNGTAQAGSAGTPGTAAVLAAFPTGLITFSGGRTQNTEPGSVIAANLAGPASVRVGTVVARATSITIGKDKRERESAAAIVDAIGTTGTIKAYRGPNSVTPTCAIQSDVTVCLVDTSTYTNGNSVTMGTMSLPKGQVATFTATAGGSAGSAAVAGTPATGWSDFKPALTTTPFIGGADAMTNVTYTTACGTSSHIHRYDEDYEVTGVDMLNPSNTSLRLSNAIPSATTSYKVIAHNQYLSPAVKIHIGNPTYVASLDVGYINIKDFTTSSTLPVASLPTYTGNFTGVPNIGSLAINMPTDALTAKDWWGNGDVRAGLHPTQTNCVKQSATGDGNMYQPIIPPPNGVDGPGTKGYSAGTISLTATGARHNGALVIQIIKSTTPDTALEQNVTGRPEYGWRVKSGDFAAYVLAEYTTFWHHKSSTKCYDHVGWLKAPGPDTVTETVQLQAKAAGSSDPKIGDLSGAGGGTVTSVTQTVVGNVTTTTITYSSGRTATITRTANSDGSVTIVTRNADCVLAGAGCVGITETIQAAGGAVLTGGDERGSISKTGRISWHELIRP